MGLDRASEPRPCARLTGVSATRSLREAQELADTLPGFGLAAQEPQEDVLLRDGGHEWRAGVMMFQFAEGCHEGLRIIDQFQREGVGIELADARQCQAEELPNRLGADE